MQAHSKRKKSLISIILSAVVPPNARLVDLVSARDKRGVRASNILGSSSSSWYKSSGGNEERDRERTAIIIVGGSVSGVGKCL